MAEKPEILVRYRGFPDHRPQLADLADALWALFEQVEQHPEGVEYEVERIRELCEGHS